MRKLVESVASFQERQRSIVDEERTLATRNSAEIRDAVEDGRRRFAALTARVA